MAEPERVRDIYNDSRAAHQRSASSQSLAYALVLTYVNRVLSRASHLPLPDFGRATRELGTHRRLNSLAFFDR